MSNNIFRKTCELLQKKKGPWWETLPHDTTCISASEFNRVRIWQHQKKSFQKEREDLVKPREPLWVCFEQEGTETGLWCRGQELWPPNVSNELLVYYGEEDYLEMVARIKGMEESSVESHKDERVTSVPAG